MVSAMVYGTIDWGSTPSLPTKHGNAYIIIFTTSQSFYVRGTEYSFRNFGLRTIFKSPEHQFYGVYHDSIYA